MIEAISLRVASGIKSRVPEHPASVAVLQYAVKLFINTFSIIAFTLLVGALTGRLMETAVAMGAFAILRQVSGGYHLKSSVLCIVLSTLAFTLLSYADFNTVTTQVMNGAAFLLALIYAPSRIEKQTRIPVRYFKYLKLIALGIITVSFFIDYSVLAAALLVQAMTLVRGRG